MFKRSTQKSGRTALSRSLHSLIALGLASTMGISEAFANETNKQSAGTATAVRTDIQSKKMVKISGNVMSSDNQPLVGVTVIVEGTVLGTTTGLDGDYTLSVPAGSVVTFSLLGYETKKFSADAPAQLRFVTLYEAATNIDDVVVVGFGTQKKESLVSSITTISPKELKGPTSNLTTMLAGRIPGMISYQRSGEPGQDNAQFFIRGIGSFGTGKVDPLILIDGIDIRKIKISSLRRHFGQMLQDVFLFSGTIRSNIVLREEGIPDSEIMEVCRYVNADKFINKLDHGLDEEVRERGNNFSAGQRQLLSFARTIIHKPSVMILDEATANIDTETELLIQDSLEKMRTVGTMLIVAHRLSTIRNADMILVMKDGDIIEQGTHEELLARGGFYADLYNSQFEDVVE